MSTGTETETNCETFPIFEGRILCTLPSLKSKWNFVLLNCQLYVKTKKDWCLVDPKGPFIFYDKKSGLVSQVGFQNQNITVAPTNTVINNTTNSDVRADVTGTNNRATFNGEESVVLANISQRDNNISARTDRSVTILDIPTRRTVVNISAKDSITNIAAKADNQTYTVSGPIVSPGEIAGPSQSINFLSSAKSNDSILVIGKQQINIVDQPANTPLTFSNLANNSVSIGYGHSLSESALGSVVHGVGAFADLPVTQIFANSPLSQGGAQRLDIILKSVNDGANLNFYIEADPARRLKFPRSGGAVLTLTTSTSLGNGENNSISYWNVYFDGITYTVTELNLNNIAGQNWLGQIVPTVTGSSSGIDILVPANNAFETGICLASYVFYGF